MLSSLLKQRIINYVSFSLIRMYICMNYPLNTWLLVHTAKVFTEKEFSNKFNLPSSRKKTVNKELRTSLLCFFSGGGGYIITPYLNKKFLNNNKQTCLFINYSSNVFLSNVIFAKFQLNIFFLFCRSNLQYIKYCVRKVVLTNVHTKRS